MPAQNQNLLPTVLFCRSHADGSIAADWSDSRERELQGQFEVGLTVAERYLLEAILGDGAMGRVFLARDLRLDRPVAIKVVAHRRAGADLEAALQREARLGANLNHQGIAAVYDFGFHENKSYTVFEFIEGETLRTLIRRRGTIPLDETLQIADDLSVALDFAHAQGVVHRDLKPENVCFTKAGEFKILDLGLALDIRRDVETGAYSGTPAYSSPEQAACRLTDGKSDQYALALIVFELLTGRQAFLDNDAAGMLMKQIETPPPRPREFAPDLPAAAEQAILRALSKDRDERFATCREFVRELGEGAAQPTRPHLAPTPADDRIGFYIAHVAEESLLARNLGQELERQAIRLLVLRARRDRGAAVRRAVEGGHRTVAGAGAAAVAAGLAFRRFRTRV